MTPERWARISDLFDQALGRSDTERAALLAEVQRHDADAARELVSLLEAHDRPGEFLPDLPEPLEMPDLSGRVVGAYRLVRLLGAGGTGVVYVAERDDGAFAKRVAVKLLSPAFVQSKDRFLRERQVLARLEHPNIAHLVDGGTTADQLMYLVMEYVEGVPLDRYCEERRLPMPQRVALLLQVCAGVSHAHRNLIVHCDLKPENILVTAEGSVKLLDFGIARLLGPAGDVTRLRPATPFYASPEQLGGGDITTATDLYSLGVLAYVVLTGHGPYSTTSGGIDEIIVAALHAAPRMASVAPGLSRPDARALRGDLDSVLAKAIAREPHRRYASADQFAADLDAWRTGFPVHARPDSVLYRLRRAVGRHRWATAFGAAVSAALVASTVISERHARVAERRLGDLRAFARSIVFDVNDALEPIPGTTAARRLVVATGLEYLDRLGRDGVDNPALREERAAAYLRIGKVQGGSFVPNLGDAEGALSSFNKALAVIGDAETPTLERLRIEGLVAIAQLSVDPARAATVYAAAAAAAERRLAADPSDLQAQRLLADTLQGQATIANLTNDVATHLPIALRQVPLRERIRTQNGGDADVASLARAIGQVALAHEQRGAYAEALVELARAQATVDAVWTASGRNQLLRRGLAEARSRKIPLLAALGRLDEAAREGDAVIALLRPLVESDPLNIPYRVDLSYAYLRLGDARVAQQSIDEALELHRQALAIRRERAARFPGFQFVPWELTRSLNAVAETLLRMSPPGVDEADRLFAEARDVGVAALQQAPSYTQVRRQVAVAEEGLARIAGRRAASGPAAAAWQQARARWREVEARSVGDPLIGLEIARVDALVRQVDVAPPVAPRQ